MASSEERPEDDRGLSIRDALRLHTNWISSGGVEGKRAELDGHDLSGHDLSGVDLSGASLIGVKLADAKLSRGLLVLCNLSEAVLVRAQLYKCDLTGCNFSGADLTDANLRGANLSPASIRDAKGRVTGREWPANLSHAILTKARLTGRQPARGQFARRRSVRGGADRRRLHQCQSRRRQPQQHTAGAALPGQTPGQPVRKLRRRGPGTRRCRKPLAALQRVTGWRRMVRMRWGNTRWGSVK